VLININNYHLNKVDNYFLNKVYNIWVSVPDRPFPLSNHGVGAQWSACCADTLARGCVSRIVANAQRDCTWGNAQRHGQRVAGGGSSEGTRI
jgi:hypothetical protein